MNIIQKTKQHTTIPVLLLFSIIGIFLSCNTFAAPAWGANKQACRPTSRTHCIGETYGGGKVFYVYDRGLHGLIAALADGGTLIQWDNGSFTVTNAVRDGVNAGLYNTERIIINQVAGSYAAQLCANYQGGGYGDWYLPSKFELNLLYQQQAVVGGFTPSTYWSSTEYDSDHAWAQNFNGGFQGADLKDFAFDKVRAVRAF